jgi:hypothetical protein
MPRPAATRRVSRLFIMRSNLCCGKRRGSGAILGAILGLGGPGRSLVHRQRPY